MICIKKTKGRTKQKKKTTTKTNRQNEIIYTRSKKEKPIREEIVECARVYFVYEINRLSTEQFQNEINT